VLTDEASLRSWTAVANDGIIATAGILEGFAGAGASDRALLIAATVATIAGMLAAGGAKWAEVDAERGRTSRRQQMRRRRWRRNPRPSSTS
jgi:hypothetical protein